MNILSRGSWTLTDFSTGKEDLRIITVNSEIMWIPLFFSIYPHFYSSTWKSMTKEYTHASYIILFFSGIIMKHKRYLQWHLRRTSWNKIWTMESDQHLKSSFFPKFPFPHPKKVISGTGPDASSKWPPLIQWQSFEVISHLITDECMIEMPQRIWELKYFTKWEGDTMQV